MSLATDTLKTLLVDGRSVSYYSLNELEKLCGTSFSRMPYSVRILIESVTRMQHHPAYTDDQIKGLCAWKANSAERAEYPFMPARVLLQDFTGVPCVVDLAALRTALEVAGADPSAIEPSIPVDLIIDHSVQLDVAGCSSALECNIAKEFERNRERYEFLRWGQQAFSKLNVFPPALGICHQVNTEYLATCVRVEKLPDGTELAFPDTLVGTDSHTVMVNSMGVLGWGVGGIEAEAAMLGQPIPILTPQVYGFKLVGKLNDNATCTDLALTVTQILREKGVVGRFIEFFGSGLDSLPLTMRAPVANMAPEYGATMGFFPIDQMTLDYLRDTGRSEEQIALVEAYCKAQGLFRTTDSPDPEYDALLELDLSSVKPSVAGPKRPQDRVEIAQLANEFSADLVKSVEERGFGLHTDQMDTAVDIGDLGTLKHGSVVIASITSCTNTASPELMLGAGLMAKNAVKRGLQIPKFVKTSLAPGSLAVTAYLDRTGLTQWLDKLGFQTTAYGCATCIGNSGPLHPEVEKAIKDNNLVTSAVLSGNRNFEGRVHALTKANYLASPLLVLAYALAGTVNIDLESDALGNDSDGNPVYLRDIWPASAEISAMLKQSNDAELYREIYKDVDNINPLWNNLPAPSGATFTWNDDSNYVRNPPFFDDMAKEPASLTSISGARVLAVFGDFITTDHISPAGSIPATGPAGKYLIERGVEQVDFNSFGSRRGNHEVMMRGTLANIRIRNKMVKAEGGLTRHEPDGEEMSIYDAAMQYAKEKTPLVILAGKMYGAGSSRDWAAKGTGLLGVVAVIAESFERIHRSNLVEMGVLPLEFPTGQTAQTLGFDGTERLSIEGISDSMRPGCLIHVKAEKADGSVIAFDALSRIDAPIEIDYYRHGGILQYVLRNVMQSDKA
ncbi:MAG: aconitate hydratase AcnA [Spartobacteria bacterium]|nr:aconitate hydratase AcnA [Spartobacteria bacterium]